MNNENQGCCFSTEEPFQLYPMVDIRVKKLDEKAVIPQYATWVDKDRKIPSAIGMDVTAIDMRYDTEHDYFEYHTGLAFDLPVGYGMMIAPRSSIRNQEAVMCNPPGWLDTGYNDELLVCFKSRTSAKVANAINALIDMERERGGGPAHAYSLFNLQNNYINFTPPYELFQRCAQIIIFPYPFINIIEVDEFEKHDYQRGGFGHTGK